MFFFAGISALHGTVISWEVPPFTVRFYDGATFLLNAKDIAELRRLGQPTWVRSAGERHAMGNARSSPRSSTWVSSAGEMYAIGNARTSRSGAGVFGLLRELVMHITTQGTWCAPAV